MMKSNISVISLITANMVPLFGVLFLGWDIISLLILYWSELVIAGMFNIPKIIMAEKNDSLKSTFFPEAQLIKFFNIKTTLIVSFLFKFILFMSVYFFLIYPFLVGMEEFFANPSFAINSLILLILKNLPATTVFFVSHGVSFLFNFIGKKEYKTISPEEQGHIFYSRMLVLHMTILLGAFANLVLEYHLGIIIIFIVLKIIIDIYAHNREHKRFNEPTIIIQ